MRRALGLRGSHVGKVLDNLKISSILTCFESSKSITKAKLHNFKGPTRPVSKHRPLLKSYLLRVLRLSGPRLSSTEDGLVLTVWGQVHDNHAAIAAGHRDREMKPYVQYISMGHISHSPKMILGEVKRGFKTGRLQHFCICKSSTGLRCHLYGVALEVHFATAAQRWNSLFSSSSSLQPFAHNAPPPTRQASCNRDGRLTLGVNH